MALHEVLRRWFATRPRRSRYALRRTIAAAVQQLELRALLSGSPLQFIDPHPQAGNQFGATVTVLNNGNVVITSSNDSAGGGSTAANTGAGAVYLFNGQSGALISTLTGSHAGDQLGASSSDVAGVTELNNGNFVINCPNWNGNRGAVTFGSQSTGVSGTISAANSLIGSTAGDQVGLNGITGLYNGNFLVNSADWNGNRGAVTFGTETGGVTGAVSPANSLVGATTNDLVGTGQITTLSNGNFIIDCTQWNGNRGAVTFGSGATGVHGAISSVNSLVGTAANDQVGNIGVTVLSNNNYVVASYLWNNGAGAATWGSGTVGVAGAISAANSLIGSVANDFIGQYGVTALNNGNYVVDSAQWHNGTAVHAGAVTFGNGTKGVTGIVSAANSLAGASTDDYVGAFGITALSTGNYVVDSPYWNDNVGAVTFGSGTSGVTGAVSAANSLVGSTPGDFVGKWTDTSNNNYITALSNGSYVVASPNWSNGTAADAGAVTFGNGITGVTGTISSANSLVGATTNDDVGLKGIALLSNGNYVVVNSNWSNVAAPGAGAVTWGSKATGVIGTISAANSLIGTKPHDTVGSGGVTTLPNGSYVVDSPRWNNDVGAATFGNGTTGVTGTISAANSLVGSTPGDFVGGIFNTPSFVGITVLSNGSYVVASPGWSNGNAANAGAVTFGSGTTGVKGTIGAANSLVGSTTNDNVGNSRITPLTNGNFVVSSSNWNNGGATHAGAATWGSGTKGVKGGVSAANSLVGSTAYDQVGANGGGVTVLTNGNYVVVSYYWSNGASYDAGAVTFGDGTTGVAGTISSGNSLVGSTVYDYVGGSGITALSNGNFVVDSLNWSNADANKAGAVTWGSGTTGVTGTVNSANSLVGTEANDQVGTGGVTALPNGNYVVSSGMWRNGSVVDAGEVTFGNGVTGVMGVVSAANSLIGAATDDQVGSGGVTLLSNGNYFVDSPNWNGHLGAVTFGSGTTGVHGDVSSLNSVTGQSANLSSNPTIPLFQNDATGAVYAAFSNSGSGQVYRGSSATGFSNLTSNGPSIEVSDVSGGVINGTGFSNLGTTRLGTSVMRVITVSNNGNAPLIVQPVTLSVAAGFSIAPGTNFTANQMIAPGVSASFTLQLNAIATGTQSGVVTIGNNVATANSFRFNIEGTVIPKVALQTFSQFVDPHPEAANEFGATVTVLATGNVVITSSNDDAGGGSAAANTGAGAVYLYNGQTGALISKLTGSNARDQLGSSGVTALTDGNFVIDSPDWNGNRGAVTFGSGTTGIEATVSAANSLVGSTAGALSNRGTVAGGDQVGNRGIAVLTNGNYVVDSPFWSNGAATAVGAVTFGNGTSGVAGAISAANSLIGTTTDDQVGLSGITPLNNGNYVVDSSYWSNKGAFNAGAVTWGNGTTGVSGAVSAANSLVGSTSYDVVGVYAITALTNGNYVVNSASWSNGAITSVGAVTFGNGMTGVTGPVSAVNSLIGTAANQFVGSGGVTMLTNGNYVVDSPSWSNGGVTNVGAVTFGSGTVGVTGTVNPADSLVGSTANDSVGYGGVTALTNGNYVVDSDQWNNGAAAAAGAVTWGNGTTGVMGTVSAANSLVGSTKSDRVGSGGGSQNGFAGATGVMALSNGNYVVDSSHWNNGSIAIAGAVTFGNGTSGVAGTISAANSLIGTTTDDQVGFSGITPLNNGNYVVDSSYWNNKGAFNAGAVTWGNGTTGVSGAVSAANSLVGSTTNDQVGLIGVSALTNGNYVVSSYLWNNGVGAVTWGSGTAGVTGTVNAENSLIGSLPSDFVGQYGITVLANGNYVVNSSQWNNFRGAATFGNGTTGVTGIVNASNSLVGSTAGDYVGAYEIVALNNGNYVVDSPYWNNGSITHTGAVTLGNGLTGVTGPVSEDNSLVGTLVNDLVGAGYVTALSNGNYVVASPIWNENRGAATFGNGTTGVSGAVSGTNSVVGESANANGSPNITIIVDNAHGAAYATFLGNGTSLVNRGSTATGFSSLTSDGPSISVSNYSAAVANGTGSVNFGNATQGSTVAQTITVTNNGNKPLIVQPVTVTSGFSIVNNFTVNQSIPSGASATFTLQRSANSVSSGVVTIPNNDPTSSPFTFNITGVAAAPVILVQQQATNLANGTSTINFGNTPVGTPITRVITVTNSGNAPLIVQPVTAPAGFSIVPNTNFMANQMIAAGSSASFTVQLNATVPGNPTGVLTIPDNDALASPFTFNVTGIVTPTSVTVPVLVVQQGATTLANSTEVYFNSDPAGTPVSQVFQIHNYGNAPLLVSSVTVTSGFSLLNDTTSNQPIPAGASASFTIQLNANATGTPTGLVTIISNDLTAASFSFNVVANHRPTAITLGSSVVNLSLTNAVGLVATKDPDLSAVPPVPQTFAYSIGPTFLSGVQTSSTFAVNVQGILAVATAAQVGVYSTSLTSTDQGGLPVTQNFTIYVTGNSAPPVPSSVRDHTQKDSTIASLPQQMITVQDTHGSSANNATRNQMIRSSVRALSAATTQNTDTRVINVVTYQLGVGGDNSDFTIDASGRLQNAVTLDAAVKSSYHITIISTDTITGLSTTYPYTITVVPDVKHTLVVTPATLILPEASVNGATVGTVSATDVGGQKPTFAITGGNTGGAFTINSATGRITVANSAALDLATHPTFSLTVQATDNDASGSAKITINLTGITLSTSSVPQTATIGTVIGQFKTVAPGTGNSFHYALAPGKANNADFTIDASGQLKLNVRLNAAVKNSYSINVVSTDQHGVSRTRTFTITILGPSNITLSNSSIARTAAIGTVVGQLSTTDAGTGNTFRYSLVPSTDNDAEFTIDPSGRLKLNVGLVTTLLNNLTIDVVSTDQRGLSITKTFVITVLGPSNITLSNTRVARNAPIGTLVGQFKTADAGLGNTFTYVLPTGVLNNADFTIDASGGLKLHMNHNTAPQNRLMIHVISTDQRGLSIGRTFTITIHGRRSR